MSEKKLILLGYPISAIDYGNSEHLRELVLFLEHQYIRLYKIEDRDALETVDGELWNKSYAEYLAHLNCPLSLDHDSPQEIVDWLLTYAVDSLYKEWDNAEVLTAVEYEKRKAEKEKKLEAIDPLSTLDFSTEESKGAVEALRDALKIAAHPENLVVLKACCKFIIENLSNLEIQLMNKEAHIHRKTMPLNHFEMGMLSSKNGTVDAAVRALRLIHLENLREVQTKINEAVVVVQELTADPKTDKRLGKVGF